MPSHNQKNLTHKDFSAVPTTATAKKVTTTITRLATFQAVAATAEVVVGVVRGGGRITACRVLSKDVAAAAESATVDLKIEGVTVSSAVATLDDTTAAGAFVDVPLDLPLVQFSAGQRAIADITYTAGGGPTPLTNLYVEVDVEYDR